MIRESPQDLDPLGGVTARMLVLVASALIPVFATITSLASMRDISNPALAILAIAVVVVACAYYVRATSPFRAPFTMGSHAIVCLLALAAVALDAVSQAGSNSLVRDDWAPVAIAALTVTFGAYRPPWEILVCGVFTAVVVATVVLLGSSTYAADVPPVVFALVASLPVLAAALAASAISRSLVNDLRAWRAGAGSSAAEPAVVESTVAQHRALAERGALPFLRAIVDAAEITAEDTDRARALANELRALMILDTEQSWVTRLVTGADDPQRLSDGMLPDQRGCLRAIVNHAEASIERWPSALRLSFANDAADPALVRCELGFDIRSTREARVQLGPFIAIARAVFTEAAIEFSNDRVTIRLAFAGTTAVRRSLRRRPGSSATDRDTPLRHASVDS